LSTSVTTLRECNGKMIMSYLSKKEMSYCMGAKLSPFKRRQDGRKGHNQDEPEGAETFTCDS
jgi:hypothetical protein